jgi:hypothetical protein
MALRPLMLALVLVAGAASASAAQSDEYPFRRFRMPPMPQLRFSTGDFSRIRANTERIRKLAVDRSLNLAERARSRELAKWGREFSLRSRSFDLQDRAHRRALELQFRNLDRLKDRFQRYEMVRPLRIKRHSRVI